MTTRFYRCELSRIVAQYVLHKMVELKVPTQIEYLRESIVLVVPGSFAAAVVKAKEDVQHALDRDAIPGSYR